MYPHHDRLRPLVHNWVDRRISAAVHLDELAVLHRFDRGPDSDQRVGAEHRVGYFEGDGEDDLIGVGPRDGLRAVVMTAICTLLIKPGSRPPVLE